MLREATAITQSQEFEDDTWLEVAIKVVREVLKMRIISSDNDQLAVVFYGTVRQYSMSSLSEALTTDLFTQHDGVRSAEGEPEQQCF